MLKYLDSYQGLDSLKNMNFDDLNGLIKDIKIFQLGDIYNKTICDNNLYIKYQKKVPIARKIACNSMSFPIYPYMNKDVLIKAIQEYNSLL